MESRVDERILRGFRVGYAPIGHQELLDHLARWRYSDGELQAAGVATRSGRGRLHVHFRSRVMFPITDPEDRIVGFAGLATHLGPSWPLWLISPERGRFRRAETIFGIVQASPAIAAARRALVSNDCLEVLRLHQRGSREAVAIVQSPLTRDHLGLLAAALSVDRSELGLDRERAEAKGLGDALIVGPHEELGVEAIAAGEVAGEAALALTPGSDRPEWLDDTPTVRARITEVVTGVVLGVGIPLGSVAIASPDSDDPGGAGSGFVVAIGGVAVAYVVLAIIAAYISGRTRARSSGRRMRAPWEHGGTEWQPDAWTYHTLEEILIAAALISALTSMLLFLTIGGFTG